MKLIKCWGYINNDDIVIGHPIEGRTPAGTRENLIRSVVLSIINDGARPEPTDENLHELLYLFLRNEGSAHTYQADNKKSYEKAMDDLAKKELLAVDTIDCQEIITKIFKDDDYYLGKGCSQYRIKAGTADELEVMP